MCSTRKCLIVLSCLLVPVTASGADFALSIDAPGSVTVSSEFDAVLRGTSVDARLIAYSALLEYDTTALSLIAEGTGFAGTVWALADFQSVKEEPGGRIRVATVMQLPSAPGGPASIAPGQNLAFLKLRFRADHVRSGVEIGFAGTVDDNLLADVNLVGHDTSNGLELTPATVSVLDDISEIDVTPLALNFGEVLLGAPVTRQIVVGSSGLSTLEVMSVSLGSGSSDDFEITSLPGLPTELAPGSSFVIQVRYDPSNVGTDNGTLLIESDDPDESTVTVSLSGRGVPEPTPEVDVFPVSIDYGEIFVGSSANRNVRVRNFGTGPLRVASVQLSGAIQDFLLNAVPSLPASVPPSGELVFKVRYAPSGVGVDNALVRISTDDPDEAISSVPLTGAGVELVNPEVDVSPLSVNFGTVVVGASGDETVRIANLGTTPLRISALALAPATSSDFSLGAIPNLPTFVSPGGELLVDVIYNPSDVGPDSGGIVVLSNDTDESNLTIPLAGEGSGVPAPEIDLSRDEIDFGRVEIGASSGVTLTVFNRGTLPLEITALMLDTLSSRDFALSGVPALPHSIAAGGQLALSVTYTPRQLGSDFGSVFIRSSDADESITNAVLTGFGLPEQRQGVVAHLPLNCNAEDIINDETGLAIGSVRCGLDRFDGRNQSIRFGEGGFIAGLRFPVVEGDFILDAWVRPELSAGRTPAEIFVIHNEQAPLEVPALTVEWDKDARLLRAKRQNGESAEFGGLVADWHHVLLARSSGVLSLYIDGQLKDTMADAALLGGAYALGSAPHSTPAYHGRLDELVLEAGTLDGQDGAIARALRGGRSVYVHPSERVKAITVNPGFTVEALDLHLTGAEPAGLEITRLELVGEDVTPDGGEAPALDYLLGGRLVLQTECGVEDSEVAVAELLVTEVSGGTTRIELSSAVPALIPNDACLVALFELGAEAPLNRVIQFSLESFDDLAVVNLDDQAQYLVGERLENQAALQGHRLRIRTSVPPELDLEFPTDVPTFQVTGGSDDAEMHVLTLAAGASEGLKVLDVNYRAAESTSLRGVSNVRLFADLNANGELDAGEDAHAGVIDIEAGSVAFSGLGIEIPAADQVDLVVLADLEFFEEPVENGGAGSLPPLPFAGPGFPHVPLMLLAIGALSFFVLASARRRPELAEAIAVVVVSCVFGFGVGCSGGGGGGGGGKSPAGLTQSFQLVIENEDALRVEGLQSETEPALHDFPADGIPGALYVVKAPE